MTSRAAAVVGAGIVSPAGSTVDDAWAGILDPPGTSAVAATYEILPDSPALICRARGFIPEDRFPRHELRRLDRAHQMAMWAADDAMHEAGASPAPDRCAVVVGIGFGAAATYERQLDALRTDGPRAITPMAIPLVMPNSIAAHLSIRYGFAGPSITVASACASGAMAIGEALWLLRTGRADRVLAGGVDALDVAHIVGAFQRLEAMSRCFDDPARSSRPFTAERDGFVLGEGAAFVVLEREDEADRTIGAVLGYGSNSDAHHLVAPHDDGAGAARCMVDAVADAGVASDDIDHINAHGTSTQRNDLAEARAIRAAFGRRLPVTAPKGAIGHLIGGAGAVEALLTIEALRRGNLPATANATDVDPEIAELIDVNTDPTAPAGTIAISNSFGFGGHNTCLVLGTRP